MQYVTGRFVNIPREETLDGSVLKKPPFLGVLGGTAGRCDLASPLPSRYQYSSTACNRCTRTQISKYVPLIGDVK